MRARDIDHATRLIAQGANHVVPETTEASLQLSEMVLMGAGDSRLCRPPYHRGSRQSSPPT